MGAIAALIMGLISEVMPLVSAASAAGPAVSIIAKVIGLLEALAPTVIQEAKDLYPVIKNAIATLRGSPHITKEQLDQLDTIEAKIDADSDAALAQAKIDDAAAAAAPAAAKT